MKSSQKAVKPGSLTVLYLVSVECVGSYTQTVNQRLKLPLKPQVSPDGPLCANIPT